MIITLHVATTLMQTITGVSEYTQSPSEIMMKYYVAINCIQEQERKRKTLFGSEMRRLISLESKTPAALVEQIKLVSQT